MRRIRISVESLKNLVIEVTEDEDGDDSSDLSPAALDAATVISDAITAQFGFTPFSENNPFPDEE